MMPDIEASSNHYGGYHHVDQLPPDQIMSDDMPYYEPPTFQRSGVKNPRRRRRRILMAIVAACLAAVLVIVLAVILGGGDRNNGSNSSRSSGASDGDTASTEHDSSSDFAAVPTVAPTAIIIKTTTAPPTTAPIAAPTAGPITSPTGGPTLTPTSVTTVVNTTAPTPLPERFLDVVEFLTNQGISSLENLTTEASPQNLAALWIADQDALRLPFGSDDYQVGVVNEAYDFVVRYVLAVLYLSTGGPTSWWTAYPRWNNALRFLSANPVCQWSGPNLLRRNVGVYCENDQITRLRLDFMGLEGRVPEELGKIWTLYSIHFNWNFLTGPLPEAITELPLTFLAVMRNNLQGLLPANLGQNGELRVLVRTL